MRWSGRCQGKAMPGSTASGRAGHERAGRRESRELWVQGAPGPRFRYAVSLSMFHPATVPEPIMRSLSLANL